MLRRLGDFELIREIGRGGMGVVYEARQLSLNRRVALKVLPPGLGLTKEARTRFEREAHAAAKLHHTNIVPVHAIGEQEGHHFYAMELIEGKSLAAVLDEMRGGPGAAQTEETRTTGVEETDEDRAVPSAADSVATTSTGRQWFDLVARRLAEVAEALDYAHSRGVIHRDIKPANLLFDAADRLCIADFGLARLTQEPGMTVSGSFLGTPAYMPPEQISGTRELDHRADIYALGVVMYEMLTLRRPFSGRSREQIVSAVMTKEPLSPRRLDRKIPLDLETVCLKAMEKDPARRYASAGEMANDLRTYLAHGLITARRAGPIRRAAKLVRRRPVASTVTLAAVLLVIAAGVIWWTWGQRSKEATQRVVAEAQFLLEQGDSESALAVADKALAGDPQSIEARRVRARALVDLWRWDEAVEEARLLLESDPGERTAHLVMVWATKDAALQRADIDVQPHLEALAKGPPSSPDTLYAKAEPAGSPEEKLELLNRTLELQPDHVLALRLREGVHRSRKDFAAALRDAERLEVAVGKHGILGRTIREQLYRQRHDYQKALELSERTIQLHPDEPYAHGFRALIFGSMGQYEDAIESFTRSIEAQPLGEVYWLRGDYDRAAADYQRSVELRPDHWAGYASLYTAYLVLGEPTNARAALDRLAGEAVAWSNRELRLLAVHNLALGLAALGDREQAPRHADAVDALDPSGLWTPLTRAAISRRFNGIDSAASDCARFAELPADDLLYVGWVLDGLLGRGNALRDACQQYDLAVADYDRAIELAPWWPDPYRDRAMAHRLQGDLEASLTDLEKAIELQPRWPDLYHDLGRVYLEQERFDAALDEFEHFLSFEAESDDLRRDQAMALLRLGRVDEAIGILRDAIERRPKADWLRNWLGEALLWLGRTGEAIEAHGAAIESQPAQAAGYAGRGSARLLAGASCNGVQADLQKALELKRYARDTLSGVERVDPQQSATVADGPTEIRGQVAWAQAAYGHTRCPDLFDSARTAELAREAVAYDPLNADYQRALGMALHRAGSHEEARDAFLRSLDLRTHDDVLSLLRLAMAQNALGNGEEGREAYDRARERAALTYPRHPGILMLQSEVESIADQASRGGQ
jgi:tetratricopeptide (TPR) repeat protein